MKRTNKFIPKVSKSDEIEISRLNNLFYENEHELLRGGRMKKSDKDLLQSLYYKYLSKVDNHDWSKDLIEMELDNLKNDPFCKKNTNKTWWSMSILLSWVAELPSNATQDFLYRALSSRPAYQRIINYAYWQ